MTEKQRIGQNIRAARQTSGLTQRKIENALGVGRGNLSNWERGVIRPCDYALKRIAKVCGVSVQELIDGEIQMPRLQDPPDYQKEHLRAIALRQISMPRARILDPDRFDRYLLDALTAAAAEYMKCLNKEE